ncbi:hypothetical protein AHiyo4_17840 [Arthrobacter sp. Hiyo4]|nr:hypothetical protein AHiyo4_17840 [Arthrobacter sp. Hiyo4]
MSEHQSNVVASPPEDPYRPQLAGFPLAPPERTLMAILADSAARFPEASALDDGRRSLSYADLMTAVRAKGRELQAAGLGPATG